MVNDKRSLWVGTLGAILLSAAFAAQAQESESETVIGPPQLKDFRLPQNNRIGNQPALPPPVTTIPARPVLVAPPPPASRAQAQPQAETPPRTQPAQQTATRPPSAAPVAAPTQTAVRAPSAPVDSAPAPTETAAVPLPIVPADSPPVPAPAAELEPAALPASSESRGSTYWYYALPAAVVALLGAAVVRRRRRRSDEPIDMEAPAAAPPPKPRPDPMPRPWLELSLKAERASFTATEAMVYFELEIANKGKAPARNLRLDVKMFNAGAEQDKEIGAFFKTAGRESTKLTLPVVEAGVNGVIHGSVRMPREEMRAMRLDERLLFIPVVAVNTLYDWGENRTGQTSRSYLVGREQEANAKMGAFRVDLGPRVWRTVGQRAHTLTKRV